MEEQPSRQAVPQIRRKRVVIVGAGMGGLQAAKQLEKQKNLEVVIIDRHNYHTFQPLLYQVATAGLAESDVAYPVRGTFRRKRSVLFKQGVVTGVDWDNQSVQVEDEEPVSFDYLIVAAGSATAYFGVPGAEENSFPLYSLPDALRLRNHLLSLFEAADSVRGLVDEGILNFVVVGGGATGVEVSGSIAELIDNVLEADFHDLDVHRARVILVERADALLMPFDPRLREYTREVLEKRGVEVRLNTAVAEIAADHVKLAGGESIPTRLVVWGAGVQAGGIAGAGGWKQGPGGRITVEPDLSVPGNPNVFAIGDIADIADGDGKLPQLAQVAMQGGKFVAKQIKRDLVGEPRETFKYFNKGTMATIGRRAAVAELRGGARLTGRLAWLAWLFLHLIYLMGARNKASTFTNWFWNYYTWASGPRLILNPERLPQSPRKPPDAFTPRTGRDEDESLVKTKNSAEMNTAEGTMNA